jgi:BirA family transcriptional regulator, biotin operon repressor / biotin---[acetyl-CoA-carboxylase] ligase
MIPIRRRLLGLLADGTLHSGGQLAAELGVTRAAIWKHVAELRELGIDVLSLDRRGYQLPARIELVDADRIRATAVAERWPLACELEVLFEIDSTNDYLYSAAAPAPGHARLVFAEWQRAGRGRRGRSWLAPFGSGLTFSIGWTFADMPADLSALSLAMGVQVVHGLRRLGAEQASLKWPNDIVVQGRKLGGLLTQLRSEAGGPAYVVVGLGLNLDLPAATRAEIDVPGASPVCDLREAMGGVAPERNRAAASVASAMLEGLGRFATEGFAPFAGEWHALDSLRGEPVRIVQGSGEIEGIARGVDPDGALRLERAGRIERYVSGDVSLRRAGTGGTP